MTQGAAMYIRIMATVMMIAGVVATSTAQAQQQPTDLPSDASPPDAGSAEQRGDPEGRNFVDKARQWAKDTQIVERLSGEIDGWYPRLGGMTRGSGFGIGPGYRFHLGDVFIDLSAAYSLKAYKAVDANVRWLRAYDNRFELWTNYRFEDFPQEDFFGMGLDSTREARTSYDFDSHDVNVEGRFKATEWLNLSALVGLMGP